MEKHGPEAEKHLFRCLLNAVDFSQLDSKGISKDTQQQLHLLMIEAVNIISKPNFVSVLCYGFEKLENKVGYMYVNVIYYCMSCMLLYIHVYNCTDMYTDCMHVHMHA